MSTVASKNPYTDHNQALEQILDVEIRDAEKRVYFTLEDGRIVGVPFDWSWRLSDATDEQRRNFSISPSGYGVHWPDLDEDISARGILRGRPATRPSQEHPQIPDATERSWTPGQILRLRKRMGLPQQDFAERVGIRQATVSDWENGKQEPSRMACRLLDMLDRTAQETTAESDAQMSD